METKFATAIGALTVISTGLGIYISASTHQINERIGAVEEKLKVAQETRAERESFNDLTMQVYQQVEKAAVAAPGDTGVRQQKAARALIVSLLKHDPQLREALLDALSQTALPEAKKETLNSLFDVQQQQTRVAIEQKPDTAPAAAPQQSATRAPSWGNYDIDVFYCDEQVDTPKLKGIAVEMLDFRLADKDAAGRWRVRTLPASVNQRPGYNVRGAEVRYSSADEKPLAERLKGMFEKKYPGMTMALKPASQNTPWYLSAFVCPAGLAAVAPAGSAGSPTASAYGR